MNSIADALRKLHPEMNAKMVFTPERGQTPAAPVRPSTSLRDEPIDFQLDPSMVAQALTAGISRVGQTASPLKTLPMADPLARRLMRRSLQGVALLSLAGLVGVLIGSVRLNQVSARVTVRSPESELTPAADADADAGRETAAIQAWTVTALTDKGLAHEPADATEPAATEPAEDASASREAPAAMSRMPATGISPSQPDAPVEVAAAPTTAMTAMTIDPVGDAGSAGPSAPAETAVLVDGSDGVQVSLPSVAKAVPVEVAAVAAPVAAAPVMVTRRPATQTASAANLWTGPASAETLAEIPYESDEPLYAGDFPAAQNESPAVSSPAGDAGTSEAPMRLEGIFWEKQRPLALINGQIIEQGGTFRGVKVLEINRTNIVISEKGEKRVLMP